MIGVTEPCTERIRLFGRVGGAVQVSHPAAGTDSQAVNCRYSGTCFFCNLYRKTSQSPSFDPYLSTSPSAKPKALYIGR